MIFFFIKNLKHFISYYLSKIRGNWLYFLYYYNLQIWLSKILSEVKVKVLITQSCPTLWYTMNCSFPGSSVHGRILKWVAIPFSRGFYQPRDWIQVSCIASRFLAYELPGKPIKPWVKDIYCMSFSFPHCKTRNSTDMW